MKIVIPVVTTDARYNVDMDNQLITIGKASKLTDCNIETIRYYEKEKLVAEPPRSDGGHRIYSNEHIQRLIFIRRSRELGFSMKEIRQLLSLVDGKLVSCELVKDMADVHREKIRAKITDLRKMERSLKELSSQCSGNDVPDCPIIGALLRD